MDYNEDALHELMALCGPAAKEATPELRGKLAALTEAELRQLQRRAHDACCALALEHARRQGVTKKVWLPSRVICDAVMRGGSEPHALHVLYQRTAEGEPLVIAASLGDLDT